MAPCRRHAFTFTELVVIVFIAVVIGGILLMWLLRLREQGNRASCENNLRRLGEAVYSYRDHTQPHALPPSRIADGYATWAVLLAPYLDRNMGRRLSEWDLTRPYVAQADEIRQAQISLYYCPARRSPGPTSVTGDVGPSGEHNEPGALGDYASSGGDGDPAHPWNTDEANGAMMPAKVLKKGPQGTILKWQGRLDFRIDEAAGKNDVSVRTGPGEPGPIREIKRGTSYTILIGDKHVRPEDFGRAERGDGSLYNGGRPASHARIGGPGHGIAPSPDSPFEPRFPVFGSWHPRGMCNFLMADGSVRAIDPGIDGGVLADLTARQTD
jgi:prepilin-type processing-associated H-X9-DG protein